MLIYPSILEQSAHDLISRLKMLAPFFSHFQIDIADGVFVPNKTVQLEDILNIMDKLRLTANNKTFEFHLMVKDYEKDMRIIDSLSSYLHITTILIHLQALHQKYKIQDTTYKPGIVLNPEDSVDDNWETIQHFSTVQIMTVHPGAQGTPFVPEALEKIDELRKLGYDGKIILDGAINDKTLSLIVKRVNLPDAVAPGSYFKTSPAEKLATLQLLLS